MVCTSQPLKIWWQTFDSPTTILISLKTNVFAKNNFFYKSIPNNLEFTFVEKNLEKKLFCSFQKFPLLIEWPLYI